MYCIQKRGQEARKEDAKSHTLVQVSFTVLLDNYIDASANIAADELLGHRDDSQQANGGKAGCSNHQAVTHPPFQRHDPPVPATSRGNALEFITIQSILDCFVHVSDSVDYPHH